MHSRVDAGVRPEIFLIADLEELNEPRAGAVDPALDRPNPDIADLGGLLVGKTFSAHEKQRFPLVGRELAQGNFQIADIECALLIRLHGEPRGVDAFRILDFPAPAPHRAVKLVAQNRVEPSHQVRTRLKLVLVGPRTAQGFLDEIVGPRSVIGHGNGKSAQFRYRCKEAVAEFPVSCH